jgi:hypothetical protein
MQEVNLKISKIFNLFYSCFCFGPYVCTGNSTHRDCGVLPWRCNVSTIILLHTQRTSWTYYKQLFLFTPLVVHLRHTGLCFFTFVVPNQISHPVWRQEPGSLSLLFYGSTIYRTVCLLVQWRPLIIITDNVINRLLLSKSLIPKHLI